MRHNQKRNLGLRCSQRKLGILIFHVKCVLIRKAASWETFSQIMSIETLTSPTIADA